MVVRKKQKRSPGRTANAVREPTGPHAAFQRDIFTFVEALKKSRHGSVRSCSFGPAKTEAQIDALERIPADASLDDEFVRFPEGVRSIASSFDGAALDWAWTPRRGPSLTGAFRIPSLRRWVKERGPSPCEFGVNWPLDLQTRYSHVVDVCTGHGELILLVDRETDYAKSEELEISRVLAALADHLALPGWELSLYARDFEEGQKEALEACRSNAIAVRTALELPIPERLLG